MAIKNAGISSLMDTRFIMIKNREANDWLGGKTLSLPGGGKLQPE